MHHFRIGECRTRFRIARILSFVKRSLNGILEQRSLASFVYRRSGRLEQVHVRWQSERATRLSNGANCKNDEQHKISECALFQFDCGKNSIHASSLRGLTCDVHELRAVTGLPIH
jgi:hypothetical protein